MPTSSESFTRQGELLVPGRNVDKVDVAAGLAMAARLGYDDAESQMVIEYGLMRWRRGEEAAAERMVVIEYRISETSWRVVLAEAVAAASMEGEG